MTAWRIDCVNCGTFEQTQWNEPLVCPRCKITDIDAESDDDKPILPQAFQKSAKQMVLEHIDQFFADKMFHCGGSIPKRFLHDPEKITMVLNFNIIKGIDKAYEALEKTLDPKEIEYAKKTGNITSDIKLVNETLNLLACSKVPAQFAGGMMIMYLEFVEGVEFE
jgi:hypothetical protein